MFILDNFNIKHKNIVKINQNTFFTTQNSKEPFDNENIVLQINTKYKTVAFCAYFLICQMMKKYFLFIYSKNTLKKYLTR